MDPISYGVAAKQKQRIEKVIAEPDSTSGVITVPKVIAAGETITVPAGRTAVLPNVQVDGELVVDGEVFIPSGSSYTATNINVSGVGSRITGDFSNATVANRTIFQTSVANSSTGVYFIPNVLSGSAAVRVTNSSDTVNFNSLEINANPSTTSIISNFAGTASALPLTFITNNIERMRIDTAGNVGIGTQTPEARLHISSNGSTLAPGSPHFIISGDNHNGRMAIRSSVGGAVAVVQNCGGTIASPSATTSGMFLGSYQIGGYAGDGLKWTRGAQVAGYASDNWNDTSIPADIVFQTASSGSTTLTERARITSSGNVLVTGLGGLGYGTGSGGTVTQLTSKSTAVTLNKPTGQITMNNEALAAGASVLFQVNNSLITSRDTVSIGGQGYGWNYRIEAYGFADGSFSIRITNLSSISLSEALVINFQVFKGAIA